MTRGRGRTIVLAVLVGLVVGALAGVAVLSLFSPGRAPVVAPTSNVAVSEAAQGVPYPGNPKAESTLVDSENARVSYVRTVTAAALWQFETGARHGPYVMQTPGTETPTLVLPARADAYTVTDLSETIPDDFVKQSDGSYLLKDNVAVLAGATLSFSSTKGLDIQLASGPNAFVSIVTLGGNLEVQGSAAHPVTISSWDASDGSVDTRTADGRAYLRVVAGHASLEYASVSDLGFWSGETGGLALTGTDAVAPAKQMSQAANQTAGQGSASQTAQGNAAQTGQALNSAAADGPVSATISHVDLTDNAYGLFVSTAKHVAVSDSTISGSLCDGLVFHRDVTASTVTGTTSTDNAVDGFSVDRSSQSITFTGVQASGNGRNGITLDGRALADGPNATGAAVVTYGNNSVSGSIVTANGHYGIQISGGHDVTLAGNHISQNDVGIVADAEAGAIKITDNKLISQDERGIAVRGGVVQASLTKNLIRGGDTGIYVRDSSAKITGNTISAVTNHGISLVGNVNGARAVRNQVAGTGTLPVWTKASTGGVVTANNTAGWHRATTPSTVIHSIFQPLTTVWICLGVLLLITALTHRGPQFGKIRDPYSERVPLVSLTRGKVPRDSVGAP